MKQKLLLIIATVLCCVTTMFAQTNNNGMISLIIGPDQPNSNWNAIQWKNARIETELTLGNLPLGTLRLPIKAEENLNAVLSPSRIL